ncbi:MAG: hypothetical protein AB7C89_06460 [Intestinibacillus sp.]
MTDRVPTYPGRIRLAPVTGQPNVYDLTREDSPITAGDALNKANLLPDSVATALGLTGNPQIKDALMALQVYADSRFVTGSYTGDGTASRTISLGFTPRAVQVLWYGYAAATRSSSFEHLGGLAVTGVPAKAGDYSGYPNIVEITTNGFKVFYDGSGLRTNMASSPYTYMAWR